MIRDLVIQSRSYRSYDETKPIAKETLLEMIDTVRLVSSAVNRQPLKYRLCTEKEETDAVLTHTAWAGLLKDVKLPPEGHHPSAFVVICHDIDVAPNPKSSATDVGIAAATLLLDAVERGFGGCMIGAFNPEKVSEILRLPEKDVPVLLVALGTPDETVFLTELPADGSTAYFRDKAGLHFVPKRSLESVLID